MDITSLRLLNQHLTGDKFYTPQEVVKHLGAVQAQDFPAAKWGLALRMKNTTDAQIAKAYDEGKIIRTHVMRPTWHFILPENLLWMQELTSHRVKQFIGHYNRKLELTDELFKKTNSLIVKNLKNGNYLTRQELKLKFIEIGIETDVQRLAHIIMWAELDGLICSGPRQGKQFTYALVEERIKKHKKLSREEQLATLTLKYFISHGPAQLKDFAWWSGLSSKDATLALDSIKSKLNSQIINEKTYWHSPKTKNQEQIPKIAFLLSIFDEYTIAYRDRSDLARDPKNIEKMIMMGNALTAVMVLDGKVVGTWKKMLKKNSVQIILNPFEKIQKNEFILFEKETEKLGVFLGLKTEILA